MTASMLPVLAALVVLQVVRSDPTIECSQNRDPACQNLDLSNAVDQARVHCNGSQWACANSQIDFGQVVDAHLVCTNTYTCYYTKVTGKHVSIDCNHGSYSCRGMSVTCLPGARLTLTASPQWYGNTDIQFIGCTQANDARVDIHCKSGTCEKSACINQQRCEDDFGYYCADFATDCPRPWAVTTCDTPNSCNNVQVIQPAEPWGSQIDCDGSSSCSSARIILNETYPADVNCIGFESCSGALVESKFADITCRNGACNTTALECHGGNPTVNCDSTSCVNMQLNCEAPGAIYFNCLGGSCHNTVQCPDQWWCEDGIGSFCSPSSSCVRQKICDSNRACFEQVDDFSAAPRGFEVGCRAYESCQSASITTGPVSHARANCIGERSCFGATFSGVNLDVDCDGPTSCQGATFRCPIPNPEAGITQTIMKAHCNVNSCEGITFDQCENGGVFTSCDDNIGNCGLACPNEWRCEDSIGEFCLPYSECIRGMHKRICGCNSQTVDMTAYDVPVVECDRNHGCPRSNILLGAKDRAFVNCSDNRACQEFTLTAKGVELDCRQGSWSCDSMTLNCLPGARVFIHAGPSSTSNSDWILNDCTEENDASIYMSCEEPAACNMLDCVNEFRCEDHYAPYCQATAECSRPWMVEDCSIDDSCDKKWIDLSTALWGAKLLCTGSSSCTEADTHIDTYPSEVYCTGAGSCVSAIIRGGHSQITCSNGGCNGLLVDCRQGVPVVKCTDGTSCVGLQYRCADIGAVKVECVDCHNSIQCPNAYRCEDVNGAYCSSTHECYREQVCDLFQECASSNIDLSTAIRGGRTLCSGTESCQQATVQFGSLVNASLVCTGSSACNQVQVSGVNIGVNCSGNACSGLSVKCSDGSRANVSCDTAGACNGIDFSSCQGRDKGVFQHCDVDAGFCDQVQCPNQWRCADSGGAFCSDWPDCIRGLQKAVCRGSHECSSKQWDFSTAAVAVLECTGVHSCRSSHTNFGEVSPANMSCTYHHSCASASFTGKYVNLQCGTDWSCYNMEVICLPGSRIVMTASSYGAYQWHFTDCTKENDASVYTKCDRFTGGVGCREFECPDAYRCQSGEDVWCSAFQSCPIVEPSVTTPPFGGTTRPGATTQHSGTTDDALTKGPSTTEDVIGGQQRSAMPTLALFGAGLSWLLLRL